MDYDDLFPTTTEDTQQFIEHINDEFNNEAQDHEPDFPFIKKRKQVHTINVKGPTHYSNKTGWILRKNEKRANGGKKRDGKDGDLEFIEYHKTSFIPGSNIKNAVTGGYYPYLVGSQNEKMLFKVSLSTGESGTLTFINGAYIAEPNVLFYDSPEEYEKQFLCVLPDAIKDKWRNSRNYHITTQNHAK
jgi:hypothetical protein